MKIRKTIAAVVIASSVFSAGTGMADAFNPQPEPPANQDDGKNPSQPARPTTPRDDSVDQRNPQQATGIAEIEFVEVAGGSSDTVNARTHYFKIKMSK